MRCKYLLVACFFLTLFSACASRKREPWEGHSGVYTQPIAVTSEPAGASVFVDGFYAGTTPCNVNLGKHRTHVVTISKEGYQSENVPVSLHQEQTRYFAQAALHGVQSAQFFKDPSMGLSTAAGSLADQLDTGETAILEPQFVIVKMKEVERKKEIPVTKSVAFSLQ